MNPQKIAKRQFRYKFDFVIFAYLGRDEIIFVFILFLTSNTCVKFYVLNICDMNWLWNWNSQWLGIIILRSSEKRVPWKFWLDPRFPRNPKLEQILKWLPLDRGCFKVYFFYKKGKAFIIISCHTYLLTRNFVVLF